MLIDIDLRSHGIVLLLRPLFIMSSELLMPVFNLANKCRTLDQNRCYIGFSSVYKADLWQVLLN